MLKVLPDNADVSNLPWITLVTLACGYIGYYIANVGNRDHHKQIDVAFGSLVFGLIAVSTYQYALSKFEIVATATIGALISVLFAGSIWRLWGIKCLRLALRKMKVSLADDLPQAWRAIFDVTSKATELSVETKNGTIYLSQNLDRFKKLPNGPCVFGSSGDILMYVTDIKPKDGEWEVQDDITYEGWGAVITYIPSSEVTKVRFRRM